MIGDSSKAPPSVLVRDDKTLDAWGPGGIATLSNHVHNQPLSSPPSSSAFPRPFRDPFPAFLKRLLSALGSGNSAKLIRFGDLPPARTPVRSGVLAFRGVGTSGVPATDRRFMDDCLGGERGRVDEECVALVNSREMEAVAVDVPEDGTGGETNRPGGLRSCATRAAVEDLGGRALSAIADCSLRIFRRDWMVCLAHGLSGDEEGDSSDSSMHVVISRWKVGLNSARGVLERPLPRYRDQK